jgi:hypothetical protein
MAHERQLAKLLSEPDARKMWARPFKVLFDFDCPDGAGYSVFGDLYFVDPVIAEAIHTGKLTVAGMSPHEVLECLLRHERIEKTLLDSDNNILFYPGSHEYATAGEHEGVRWFRGKPVVYERAFKPWLRICETKPIRIVHPQLDAAPYLDDPDREERDVTILALRKAGCVDATKKARHAVNYRGEDQTGSCRTCKHFHPWDQIRALCDGVEGLILGRMVCDEFVLKLPGVIPSRAQAVVNVPAAGPSSPSKETTPAHQAGGSQLIPQGTPGTPTSIPPAAAFASPAPGSATQALPANPSSPLAAALGGGSRSRTQPTLPTPPLQASPPASDQGAAIAKMAEAIKELAASIENRPIQVNLTMPKSKQKRISTSRDSKGNLVAHVSEEDE